MIQGGWDYVAAAYSFSYAVLFFYSVHIWRRARRSEVLLAQARKTIRQG